MGIFRSQKIAKPTPETTIAPGVVSTGEIFDAYDDYAFYLSGRSDAKANTYSEVWQPYLDEIKEKTGLELDNPGARFGLNVTLEDMATDTMEYNEFGLSAKDNLEYGIERQKAYDDDVKKIQAVIAANERAFNPKSNLFNLNQGVINDEVLDKIESVLENKDFVDERTNTNMVSLDGAKKVIGGIRGSFTDPVNLTAAGVSMILPTKSIISRLFLDGMLGGGAEAIIQKDVQNWFKENNIPYSDEEYWENVRLGVYTNLALGGALEVAGKGIKLSTKQLLEGVRAFRKAKAEKQGKVYSDDQDVIDLEVQSEINEDLNSKNPLANDPDNVQHQANIESATAAVVDGNYDAVPTVDIANAKTMDELIDASNINTQILDPDDIVIDAKRFQFKTGGDVKGRLPTLEGVQKWEDYKSNVILIFEDKNGKRFVADGHQRVNLAKELKDKGQKPRLVSHIIKEEDGWTPATARAYAARKNLAEGSADAFDAARALRLDPNALDNLPPRSKLAEFAQGLSMLDPEVFIKAENTKVKTSYLSMIGRNFDDAKQQESMVKLLDQIDPSNETKARSIIEQAKEAGFVTKQDVQTGLFGDDDIVENLFIERADILDSAIKLINNEKRVFTTLVENSPFIEKYGNKLSKTTNIQRRDLNGEIIETIKQNANIKGEISESLTKIAKQYNDGKINLGQAARQFTEDVGNRFRSGGYRGIRAGTARIDDDIAEVLDESQQPKNSIEQEGLEKFDNPTKMELDDLEAMSEMNEDLFSQIEEIDPEFAKDLEIEDGTKFTEMKEEIARDQRIIKELKDC